MIWSVIDRNSNFVWSRPKDMAKAYCRLSFTRVVYCETFFWLFFWHFEQMATNAQWGWIFFWVAFFFSCTCYFITYLSKNPSIYNIIYWFAGPMGQMTLWPCVWCSNYYLFFIKSCKILCKNHYNFFLYKITKMKLKSFECLKL